MGIEADFKRALSCWASGVSVVTARVGELRYGVTVSSFSSLSLNPPLVLFCLNITSQLNGFIDDARGFAVNILSTEQEDISVHFATAQREPGSSFGDIDIEAQLGPHPVLAGVSAHLQCVLHSKVSEGDHAIVIGRVTEAAGHPDRPPLVYYRRAYREITQ